MVLGQGEAGSQPPRLHPSLTKQDGTVATSSKEKAQLLANLFTERMKVEVPHQPPPRLEQQRKETVTKMEMTQTQVKQLLRGLDTKKATSPDNVSLHLLKQCAQELSVLLTIVVTACLRENIWPTVWKEVRVVPVHKKRSRSDPINYRPISLLSVVEKVFKRIVTQVVCRHLSENYLLSDQHFGFKPGRSTSDLLMLLTKKWQDGLDDSQETIVVALDIVGAFDRVWTDACWKNSVQKASRVTCCCFWRTTCKEKPSRSSSTGKHLSPCHLKHQCHRNPCWACLMEHLHKWSSPAAASSLSLRWWLYSLLHLSTTGQWACCWWDQSAASRYTGVGYTHRRRYR